MLTNTQSFRAVGAAAALAMMSGPACQFDGNGVPNGQLGADAAADPVDLASPMPGARPYLIATVGLDVNPTEQPPGGPVIRGLVLVALTLATGSVAGVGVGGGFTRGDPPPSTLPVASTAGTRRVAATARSRSSVRFSARLRTSDRDSSVVRPSSSP